MLGRSITEMGSPWEDDPRRVSRRGFKTARSSVLRGPPLTGVGRYVNLDPMPGVQPAPLGIWGATALYFGPAACQAREVPASPTFPARPALHCEGQTTGSPTTVGNHSGGARD